MPPPLNILNLQSTNKLRMEESEPYIFSFEFIICIILCNFEFNTLSSCKILQDSFVRKMISNLRSLQLGMATLYITYISYDVRFYIFAEVIWKLKIYNYQSMQRSSFLLAAAQHQTNYTKYCLMIKINLYEKAIIDINSLISMSERVIIKAIIYRQKISKQTGICIALTYHMRAMVRLMTMNPEDADFFFFIIRCFDDGLIVRNDGLCCLVNVVFHDVLKGAKTCF